MFCRSNLEQEGELFQAAVTLVDTYSRQRAQKYKATPSWANWTTAEAQFALGQRPVNNYVSATGQQLYKHPVTQYNQRPDKRVCQQLAPAPPSGARANY